jgi:hypothetical protein
MWAALALTTVLTAPAQAGELKLTNKRCTYGILGQTRTDNKVLPGDVLFVAFDIENLTVKQDGTILYAMGLELTKKGKSKPEFKREPQDLVALNTMGGTTLPNVAMSSVGLDTPPGSYVLKVTIKDRGGKPVKTATLEEEFEVLKPALGFVQVKFSSMGNDPAPPIAVPGQNLLLHHALVGYQVDNKKNPNVSIELHMLDANDKPTMGKPFMKGDILEDSKTAPGFMLLRPAVVQVTRSGKFRVLLKATDNLAKKTIEQKLDLEVLAR